MTNNSTGKKYHRPPNTQWERKKRKEEMREKKQKTEGQQDDIVKTKVRLGPVLPSWPGGPGVSL